ERFGTAGVRHLFSAPWMGQLVRLDLVQLGGPADDLAALVDRPDLANLCHISLSHNRLGYEGFRTLARSPHLGQVRYLELVYTAGGAPGLLELFASPTLRQVRTLFYG